MLDIKRAYKAVRIKEDSQLLSLRVWREPPHDKDSNVIIFKDTCFSFGNAQSAACLSICVDYIADQIPDPGARHTLKYQTLADDCRDSKPDPGKLIKESRTIMDHCEKYSMPMKDLAHTLAADTSIRHTPALLVQDSFGLSLIHI